MRRRSRPLPTSLPPSPPIPTGTTRSADGVRVLLESLELVAGPPAYRYLRPRPPLAAALVGALWDEMPMTLSQFTNRVYEEWSLVVSEHEAAAGDAGEYLEGADLV